MSSRYRIIPHRIRRLAHISVLRFRSLLLLALLTTAMSGPALSDSVDYTYDTLGRLTTVTYSSGVIITYVYDAAGNRTSYVTVGAP